MLRGGLIVATVVGCVLATASLWASFPHWSGPLRVTRIDSASGLSHNSVYAILRDRHGFVWVGTPDGLNRFDGYEVRRFHHDPDDAASLSHQVVRCLVEDREGNLWIGTDNWLNLMDRATHRFRRVPLGARSGGHKITSLFEDGLGTLWVGTDRGVFYRPRSGREFARFSTLSEGVVRDFGESPEGTVWALVQRGAESTLHALDGSGGTLAVAESWGWVTNFGIDRAGRFWLKPPLPARLDLGRTLQPVAPPDRSLVVNRVRLRNDAVWMATDRGLCHGSTSATVSCRTIDPSASWLHNFVRDVWLDDEGAVWLGSYTGLFRFDPSAKPFETWSHDERDPRTLSSDAVSAIVESRDGSLWVGTFGGGLNRLDRTRGEAARFRSVPGESASLPHDTIWALLLDPDDVLWIGTEAGLASFDSKRNRFTRHVLPFPADERVGRRTAAIARDHAGVLWIGAAGGLYSYDPATHASRRYGLPSARESPDAALEAILMDEDGTLWTGTGSVGLLRFDPATGAFEAFPRLTKEQAVLTSEGLWDIHSDRRGAFWIATGMGLSRFDRSARQYVNFLPRDGLPASQIYSIAEDQRGRLWLGTSRGLVRFDPAATGPERFRTFETTDGIAALEFNRHAAARTRSGELCFGGIGGLTCFDPARIEDDRRRPRVAFTGIELADGSRTITIEPFGREEIELRHDNDPFAFTFAALSFANPLKNRYEYKLEGFDRGWVEAGTRRLATYSNIPPGRYVFRVRASNSDLIWNREGTSIRVRILPPFWMTWWFRILIGGMVASLLYGLYRYRVSRLIEMERLRLRIASDLHDDVTSELSGISMMAELMRRRLPRDPAAGEQLGSLRDRTAALASVMRDLAWGIHPEHDTAASMIRRMRSSGAMLLGDTPLHVEAETLADNASIPMLARRSLFLVYKEALHNAARHARASGVRVSLRALDHALEMTIADDGAGFDPTADHPGDGLRNMRRRVREAGGEIEMRSAVGAGTSIVVRVPFRTTGPHEDS